MVCAKIKIKSNKKSNSLTPTLKGANLIFFQNFDIRQTKNDLGNFCVKKSQRDSPIQFKYKNRRQELKFLPIQNLDNDHL